MICDQSYDRDKLYEEVWSEPVTAVAKRYGVSDVAIHKACKRLQVPVPPRGYWAKVSAGQAPPRVPLPAYNGPQKVRRTPPALDRSRPIAQPANERLMFLDEEQRTRVLELCVSMQVREKLTNPHPLIKQDQEARAELKRIERKGKSLEYWGSDYRSNLDHWDNSRFMLQVEHMLPVRYLRYLAENSLESLGSVAFFIDGPLAVFGNAAWLHGSIMGFLAQINARLRRTGYERLLLIGLQKTGQVVDHVALIQRYVRNNSLFAIDDDYRYEHILTGRDPSSNGFGSETYYGQDFIYKTPTGRSFVFALPYPFRSKAEMGAEFTRAKLEIQRYAELPRALRLIQHFESDLYANAVIPVALAHRYTAISLVPGGRVLDLLTRRALHTPDIS